MFQRYFFFLVLFSISSTLLAQPEPCTQPPTMSSFCADACIICDIDGFTGINNAGVQGEAPPDFCTSVVHNMRWIAFIAGSVDLKIELFVDNCTGGQGLELGMYKSTDCQNFTLVSNCRGSANRVNSGTSGIFTNTEPLVIGQYYYLVMDGSMGAVCNWTFKVLEGTTQVAPLDDSGLIDGPFVACANTPFAFSVPPSAGAVQYDWTMNGQPVGNGVASTMLTFPVDGTYDVCVTASNACDKATPSCKTVQVESIPETTITSTICSSDSLVLNDSITLTQTGDYEYHFAVADGCDSAVFVSLNVMESSTTAFSLTICDGDSIFLGATPYFTAGQHSELLQNSIGCDSLVNLDLEVILCNINGNIQTIPIDCGGETTGQIIFSVADGTPPFSYTYTKFGGTLLGSGTILNLNQAETIENLGAGAYLITIKDGFGNNAIFSAGITEPTKLNATILTSDFNGFGVSCFGEMDGTLTAQSSGGTLPYSFLWDTGATTISITNLVAGDYTLTLTDAKGCSTIQTKILTSPSELLLDVLFENLSCSGLETGQIMVQNMSGGTMPYQFSLDSVLFSTAKTYSGLAENTYTLTAQDANGCSVDTSGILVAPLIPVIDLGEDESIFLSDSVRLSILANLPLDVGVLWATNASLSCLPCPNPYAKPFLTTTYTVSVTSEDGCITTDSVTVIVEDRRRVYVPNVFQPNSNQNGFFNVFGGAEVTLIKSMRIYSRWGDLVFKKENIQPNRELDGWDGRFKDKLVESGVYVWVVEVEYIDGQIVQYQGDVSIIR